MMHGGLDSVQMYVCFTFTKAYNILLFVYNYQMAKEGCIPMIMTWSIIHSLSSSVEVVVEAKREASNNQVYFIFHYLMILHSAPLHTTLHT